MTQNWFANCSTATEIKKEYRRLAMEWHPDRGGDTRMMQDINAAYHSALERMNGKAEVGTDAQEHTYWYNARQEQEIIDKLSELLRCKLPGCNIWLIGKWIWVEGDTRPSKDTLNGAGLWWHSKRTAWYWKPADMHSSYNARVDLAGLAATYGAKMFAGQDTDKAMAAA